MRLARRAGTDRAPVAAAVGLALLLVLGAAGGQWLRDGETVTPARGAPTERDFLTVDGAALHSRPTTGPEWDALRAAADRPGRIDLADQDSTTPARAVAAA